MSSLLFKELKERKRMAETILSAKKSDVVTTDKLRVACDGPVFSKHPRVYLIMVDDEQGQPHEVVCPYCSRVHVYVGHGDEAGH